MTSILFFRNKLRKILKFERMLHNQFDADKKANFSAISGGYTWVTDKGKLHKEIARNNEQD